MKKLCAVLLFVFVAMLAAGSAFAYDTKIIDDATNLKYLPANVRPIGHLGTPNLNQIYGPRRIGVGYTTEDAQPDFFSGSVVGVSDTSNENYINAKRKQLAAEGGAQLNLQQAESTAVWRAIPMMTGSLMRICYDSACCDGDYVIGQVIGQSWVADQLINEWPTPTADPMAENSRKGLKYGFWGRKDRVAQMAAISTETHYGYAVPRIEARNIANEYFKTGNPGTNTKEEMGQELLTSVFLWSADNSVISPDAPAFVGTYPDTVAVMVRLDNDLYKGLKVSDITVLKVEEEKQGEHWPFTQVYSDTELTGGKFAVVKRTYYCDCECNDITKAPTDVVLGPDEIIEAGNREANKDADDCCGAKCDTEWETMQYFVLLGVQKGDVRDTADFSYDNVISSLNLIIGHRPFTKTPDIRCGYAVGSEPHFGWVYGNRPNAEQRYDGFTRDPFLADAIDNTAANFGLNSGYSKEVLAAMKNWHQMYFVTDEVVETYGFKDAIVYRLPAVRTPVTTGQTAVVMYTIRIGNGEKELAPESIVGKTPADIRAIDVRGVLPENMGEFERVPDCRDLVNGTFAILTKDAANPLGQDVMPEGATFEADGVYFVALGVQDNGEFDQDKYGVINGQSWVSPVFLVIGGVTPNTLRVDPSSATVNVGATQQFTAKVTTGDVPAVTWESSDPAVATVDANGLATAVAVGTATITATPEAGSDFTPATATLTVEQPAPPSGGSSGGCSVGGFGPASLFLLAPLFLLLKK